MHPHEVSGLKQLWEAGAHIEVLAQVFGRDPRTIRTALVQAGVRPLSRAPLPPDWRTGLSPETVKAIRAYIAQLRAQEQAAWQRLQQVAIEVTAATYTVPSVAYTAILQTAQPPETLLLLARRLSVDVNRVLLAYAEWEGEVDG